MTEIGAFDAKTHLPKLLNRVLEGERITITRRGKPIAVLAPFEPPLNVSGEAAVRRMRALRQGVKWEAVSPIKDAIEEGRA